MRQSLGSVAILLGLLVGASAEPVAASVPQGAIIWTLDHANKTITVSVRLEIYSACDDCPGAVSLFVAEKIKAQILEVWNKPYHYKCYELVFDVDIKLGTNRFAVDDDRIGVRIDNSPVPIRSYVHVAARTVWTPESWKSNDPSSRLQPDNDVLEPTTWGESEFVHTGKRWVRSYEYAHEFAHVIGLDDAYKDGVHPTTGETIAVRNPGAPVDLMSTWGKSDIAQETIDRLVERHGDTLDLTDIKCDRYGFVGTWPLPSGNHFPVPIGAISCTTHLTGSWAVIYYANDPAIEVDALVAEMNDPVNRQFVDLWQAGEQGRLFLEVPYYGVLTPFEGPPPTVTLNVTRSDASPVHTEVYGLSAVESAPDICPPT